MKTKNIITIVLLASGLLLPTLGCGSSREAQQKKLMKYARRGRPDKDQDDPLPTNKTVNTVVTSNVGTQAAATANATTQRPTENKLSASAVAATNAIPGAPDRNLGNTLSDTMSPPESPLSEEERRQISIDNLTEIGAAIELYHKIKTGYPPPFIADGARQPMLSWRVLLLPHLGYHKLYSQFKVNEPWDSAHNAKLIEKIPKVYQSPERFDFTTNYLLPVATNTAFYGWRGKSPRRWDDGAENTILLVEANDEVRVPWTQPQDLAFNARTPEAGLHGLRSDGFFSVWGGGHTYIVPNTARGLNLKAAFTVDGGESVSLGVIRKSAMAGGGGLAAKFMGGSPASSSVVAAKTAANTGSQRSVSPRPLPSSSQVPFDAQTAFVEGREAEAAKLYYASIISGESPESWLYQYRWVPGLSRPAAMLRYGMGIVVKGKRARRAQAMSLEALSMRKPVTNVFAQLTGSFGKQVLDNLQAQPVHGPFLIEVPDPRQRRRRLRSDDDDDDDDTQARLRGVQLAPTIQFVGVDTERVLIRAAKKHEVDALVLFDIEERQQGKSWIKDVHVSVWDVVKRSKIFESKRLNSRRVHAARLDLVEDDPTISVLADFSSFLRDKMVPVEIPSALRARHAAKRATMLSQLDEEWPLLAMAEIQFYRQLDLIDVPQLVQCYSEIMDEKAALTLIGGSHDDKMELLSRYLPQPWQSP